MEPLLGPEATKVLWDARENKVSSGMLLNLEGKHWGREMLQKIPLWHHGAVHLHPREKRSIITENWSSGLKQGRVSHMRAKTSPLVHPLCHCFGAECRLVLTWTFDRIFTHRMQDSSCRLESILLQIWLNNREQSTHYVIYITSQHKVCNFLLQCYNCNSIETKS